MRKAFIEKIIESGDILTNSYLLLNFAEKKPSIEELLLKKENFRVIVG